jgi:mortality factor 4-like protein 1
MQRFVSQHGLLCVTDHANYRLQIRKLWESGKHPSWNGRGPGDAYGAEHLCRLIGMPFNFAIHPPPFPIKPRTDRPLLVSLPELIAQTNMDVQSVNKLREEISKFNSWLARNSGRFFCTKYEKPSAEYIEGAR